MVMELARPNKTPMLRPGEGEGGDDVFQFSLAPNLKRIVVATHKETPPAVVA